MPGFKFSRNDSQCVAQHIITRSVCSLALLFITYAASGSGAVQIQYLQDSSDSKDIFLDLTTDLSKNTSLFAGVGNTRSPANAADLDLDYWNIGLDYRFSKAFDIELEVGNFGQGKDINIDSIDAQLRWSSDNWSFSLKPQFDQIELLVTFNNISKIRSIDSTGLGISISYYGMKNWEYSLSYDTYDYSTDPRVLSVPLVIARLSSKALTVTSGLKDNIIAADITYLFAQTDVTIGYARSTSAIDQTTSNIASVATNFYHFLPYKVGFEAGAVGSDIDTASYYAGILAGYTW
jgi:hypothetical protein